MEPNKNNQDQSSQDTEFSVPNLSSNYLSPVESESNHYKKGALSIVVKLLIIAACGVLLFVIVSAISENRKLAGAQKRYAEAKQKCGHEPIVYQPASSGWKPISARLTLGTVVPNPDDEYFCTMPEARASGHSQEDIEYAIPENLRSQYK